MCVEKIFTIKKDDDMYDIFTNLWRLVNSKPGYAPENLQLLRDFQERLPQVHIYYDSLDLAKEFTKKLDYKLVIEEEENCKLRKAGEKMNKIELGKKVEDTITGFQGITIACCEYLNGCIRYELQPLELKDGCPQKSYWYDQQQLKLVIDKSENDKTEIDKDNITKTKLPIKVRMATGGGPGNHPTFENPPSD